MQLRLENADERTATQDLLASVLECLSSLPQLMQENARQVVQQR